MEPFSWRRMRLPPVPTSIRAIRPRILSESAPYVDDTIQTVETLAQEKTVTTIVDGQPVTGTQMELVLEDGKVYYHEGSGTHFLVNAQPEAITGSQEFIAAFNPNDASGRTIFMFSHLILQVSWKHLQSKEGLLPQVGTLPGVPLSK